MFGVVKDELDLDKTYYMKDGNISDVVITPMTEYCGKKIKLKRVAGKYYFGGYYWTDEMLKYIVEVGVEYVR